MTQTSAGACTAGPEHPKTESSDCGQNTRCRIQDRDPASNSRAQAVAHALIVLLLGGYLLNLVSAFAIPLTIAVFIAVLAAPAQSSMERRGAPRWLSTSAVMMTVAIVSAALLAVTYGAVASVADKSEKYHQKATSFADRAAASIEQQTGVAVGQHLAPENAPSGTGSLQERIASGLGSVVGIASATVFMLLFLAFILVSRDTLVDKVQLVAARSGLGDDGGKQLVARVSEQIRSYLWLKSLISIGTGTAFGFLAWALGLDFPLVWGLMGFVLNFIPSLGPIVASIPPVVVAFLQFDPVYASVVSLAMISVQFASGNVIEPVVLGNRLSLNFIVVLVSISVWGLVWGFAGMVLAVPLTACLNLLLTESPRFGHLSELLSN